MFLWLGYFAVDDVNEAAWGRSTGAKSRPKNDSKIYVRMEDEVMVEEIIED